MFDPTLYCQVRILLSSSVLYTSLQCFTRLSEWHCITGAFTLRTTLLKAVLADVKLKQASWMSNPNMAYHLTLTLDGWSNSRMESVYSWNIIFPSRKVILLRADNLSEVSHTGENLSGETVLDLHCCTLSAVVDSHIL